MPYTIRIKADAYNSVAAKFTDLMDEKRKASEFHWYWSQSVRNGYVDIEISRVRLKIAKPYCGQHAGPCQLSNKPKPNSTFLEWEDWVRFNNLMNDICDELKLEATIWSVPRERLDVGKRMFVRRDRRRRVAYDTVPVTGRFGRTDYIWNHGTSDQFKVAT